MKAKTVLITGISRGIGKELTSSFSKNGWNICGCYKNNSPDYTVPNSKFTKADISKHNEVKELIKSSISEFGKIDCVINNASVAKRATIFRMTNEMWERVIKTNLNGTFYIIKEALRTMIKQRSGSIINIASISAFKSYVGAAGYSASKSGVISLTRTAAREAGRFGITVNAVLPGFHFTSMGDNAGDAYIEEVKRKSVLNATTDIKELADFILFLAGVKTVSGQIFNFDSRIA
ncbi:beta-ketoacyl-ACP reductase [Endomicrobiia bacterium]|uniref:SDR family NAD(P)-dependent oxidoreductase n=1 Tax=Endomicrobium trichonymphae TaxID=1408204 RepID=UPI0008663F38|nr:SDR family NAD(P)-dependent oxidoreductase [Candidatus Endomicrobium trichonymphae]GHT06749.1 beta-ketoacyl-ACP reductase [Endomicrobiia bacterium]BAV59103.1 3-oxoacyl-[acyl-carrier-protein] reductase [Candidatus Endomicrobium trichonymphae]GHT10037.1 beta-ketoacyl-ACP reductase [Endomicrobiia bacterium]GHT14170.1 beta-ketoacyl-ACP reductase [Endomicrobiia bacterium]GHT16170.1 beta-ketoacyl-ACP reductase [Endomicrobiia bacterium]